MAAFYARRFGVTLDPDTEVMPAIGAKECIFNLNLAFLDPGDVALASDPGYPVYTGGPLLAGAEPVLMPLVPELGFAPDLDAIDADGPAACAADVPQLPQQPDRRRRSRRSVRARDRTRPRHELLIVHDNAYSETTYDGYVAPSFLQTPGAREVGVEVFSLSKGYNMTGWRCAAIVGNADAIAHYWRLKSNIDSGLFEAVQLAGAAALSPEIDRYVAEMNDVYRRRRDLVCDALAQAGVAVTPPKGTIYVWAPIPAGFSSAAEYCEHVLEQRGGCDLAGRRLRPQR